MRWKDDLLVAKQDNFTSSHLRADKDDRFKVNPFVTFEPQLKNHLVWKVDPFSKELLLAGVNVNINGTLTAGIGAEFNFDQAGSVTTQAIPVFSRSFTMRYFIGGVPVYQRNTLSLKVVLSAEASSKVHADAEAKTSVSVQMGAQLNFDGTWALTPPSAEFDKSFIVNVSAHGQATGRIRLIPNLQVEFYRTLAVDGSVEPILVGEIAAEMIGKADIVESFGFLRTQLTQLDFTLQAETFMGVSFGIFSKKIPLLKKTQLGETRSWLLFSLPKLSVSGGSGKVGEPITLTATTEDGVKNPFNEGSIRWNVYPNKGSISGGKTGTFVPSEEGSYTVFFSGHSRVGDPDGRQFASADVVVGKKNDNPKGKHGISDRCHGIGNKSHGVASQCNSDSLGWNGSYDDKKGRVGVWTYVYNDGSFDKQTFDANGILNGYEGHWKANCSPIGWHGNFINGKRDGVWIQVFDSGFDQNTYANDILNGYSGSWKADGSPISWHGNYDNGKLQGIWTQVHDNGGFDQNTYANSILNGYSGYWKADCSPIGWHGNFVNGNKDGIWTYIYDDSGNYDTNTYVNGILNGHSGEWKVDGSPKGCHGEYTNDKKVGVWTCYKSNGTTYTETYVAGVKQ
jgi:antitoxin component YwqK of YwqJK toxin-antitoxin module